MSTVCIGLEVCGPRGELLSLTRVGPQGQGQNQILAQIQNTGATAGQQYDRRRDDRQGRRASQAGNPVVPPSPALVRAGSKSRHPAALTAGGVAGTPGPMSAEAQIGVPVPQRRISQQQSASHPYANVGYDSYGRDEYSASQQPYGRASPMVSSVGAAPPALSNVRAIGGEVGVAHGGDYHGQQEAEPQQNTLWKILTCRCG